MDRKELFKLLSLLLDYPEKDLYEFVNSEGLPKTGNPRIDALLEEFENFFRSKNLRELQEFYVSEFDFSSKNNLYLTYHRYKDDRRRGQILAELKEVYMERGLEPAEGELPDYLPVVLEFAADVDFEKGLEILETYAEELKGIKQHLRERNNPYWNLLEILTEFLTPTGAKS